MTVKLFILGLPGSGKSTIARYILGYAKDWHWFASHYNDYAILQEMFQNDTEQKFKPAEGGGFDVLDLTVFDTALERLEQKVKGVTSSEKLKEIILIEFSRADYQRAFQQFSQDFLQNQDTYFLYFATELETCKGRIRKRTTNPTFEDDYHVSEYIFEKYYCQDDGKCIPGILQSKYQVDQQQVRIINNNCSLEEVSTEINAFIHSIIAKVETNEGNEGKVLTCKIKRWVDDTHLLPDRVPERV
ncbi:MAG TPA: hypothetical protein VF043_07690 [Ktedonobacteraceae bacterium]